MSLQANVNMESKESGLTVGELTIAIFALIVASIIWTSINKRDESNQSLIGSLNQSIAINPIKISPDNY